MDHEITKPLNQDRYRDRLESPITFKGLHLIYGEGARKASIPPSLRQVHVVEISALVGQPNKGFFDRLAVAASDSSGLALRDLGGQEGKEKGLKPGSAKSVVVAKGLGGKASVVGPTEETLDAATVTKSGEEALAAIAKGDGPQAGAGREGAEGRSEAHGQAFRPRVGSRGA